MSSNTTFPVIEIFGPVIQGEGCLAGTQTHFIRFGGCDFRCNWCDTLYASDPQQVLSGKTMYTTEQIMSELRVSTKFRDTPWITFSGGNPCLWDLEDLVDELHDLAIQINVETQGTIWKQWLHDVDTITISPKGPSSGMYSQETWKKYREFLNTCETHTVGYQTLKIVVFNNEDFEFAQKLHELYPNIQMFLQPGTLQSKNSTRDLEYETLNRETMVYGLLDATKQLWEKTCHAPGMDDVRVIPQLHSLVYGWRRGV